MYITQLLPQQTSSIGRLDESVLLEDPVYRGAKSAARVIVEYKMTEKQILDLFASTEQELTNKDTGANRTFLGKGKDLGAKGLAAVGGLVSKTVNAIQTSTPIQAVDVAYDQATDALADMVGGQDGRIMGAIKKYRMLAKEYPKTAGLAKAALVTIAGLATGGAGAPAMAAFIYGLDSAIKGERASDIALKAGTAAAMAWGAQKIAGAFQGGDTASGVTRTSEIPYEVQRTGLTGDYGMPTYNIIPGSGGAASGAASGGYSIPGGDNIFGQAAFDQDFATATGGAIDEPLKQGITVRCPLGSCNGNVWQVQPGQSITDIADQIGVTSEQIARLNPELVGLGELTQYTVKANDILSKIALDNKVEIREILGLNPQLAQLQGASAGQLANPDVLKPGMELVLPPPHQGPLNIYAGMSGTSADTMAQIGMGNMPDSAISQAMAGKTQTGPKLLGGPAAGDAGATDAASAVTAPQTIDYAKPGPMSTDSMGTKLEYGIPVNDKGAFVPPNPSLPADELAKQTAAYDSWKADYIKRFPNAIQLPDGSMQGIKPGLAPMYPGMASGLPPGLTPKAGVLPESVYKTVKLKTLPANQLIDQRLTKLSWALNESIGRPQGQTVHLTSLGTYTVFENIQRLAELDKKKPLSPEEQARLVRQQKVMQLTGGRGLTAGGTDTKDGFVQDGTLNATIDDPDDPTGEGPGIQVKFDKDYNLISSSKPIPGFEVGAPTPTTTPPSGDFKSGSGEFTPLLSPAQLAAKSKSNQPSRFQSGPGDPTPLLSPAQLAAKSGPPDLYRPDAPEAPVTPADPSTKSAFGRGLDWMDRATKKVGGALGNFGHQLTTKITKEKLKKEWFQIGKPSDSAELSAFLVKQGVPQEAINAVYSKMGIPLATPTPAPAPKNTNPTPTPAPAPINRSGIGRTSGSTEVASGLINPETKKPYTYQELRAMGSEPSTAPTTPSTTPTVAPVGYDAKNVMKLPGMEKYAKRAAAPAKTANFGVPNAYGKTTTTVKPMTGIPGVKTVTAPAAPAAPVAPGVPTAPTMKIGGQALNPKNPADKKIIDKVQAQAEKVAEALENPVAKMLDLVETKEDVRQIKNFIDQTFVKYGVIGESAFAVRNQLIEHVTHVGAQRRREFARKNS